VSILFLISSRTYSDNLETDPNSLARVIGIDDNVGADEDDFHIIGRKKLQLDKDEKNSERLQRSKDVKVGAQSGIVKSFAKPAASKKVIYF
jgi:zinc finger CCHC domain-containing protein 9